MSVLFRMDIALNRSHTPLLDLDTLVASPQQQGKGYGTQLVSAILEEAREQLLDVALCAPAGEQFFLTYET